MKSPALAFFFFLGHMWVQSGEASACSVFSEVTTEESQKIYDGCKGAQCPDLSCKDIGSLAYAKIEGGRLTGSIIGFLGYSKDTSAITNSDLKGAKIGFISSCDLTGSDLRDSVIESIENETTEAATTVLRDVDFSGATIKQVRYTKSKEIDFHGAKFNSKTKLPFSEAEALQLGMKKVE